MRGVQDLAVDVELELRVGTVAHTDRPRTAVAFEFRQVELGQASLAADAVHEL